MAFFSSRTAVVLGLLVAAYVGYEQVKHNFYVFEPDVLHGIAKGVIAKKHNSSQELFDNLSQELAKVYGKHLNLKQEWVFNNAGGAMGSMWILHASISEYLIIFGSPIGTEGHSGRYPQTDDYFIILEGEQWAHYAGDLERKVFKAGTMNHMKRGEATQYRIPDHCWALEYARGFIPGMLPFGLADALTSTLDFYTIGRTFWLYGKAVVGELLQGKI